MKFNIINIKTEEKYAEFGFAWKKNEEETDAKLLELNAAGSPPLYRKKVVVTNDWLDREADKMYTEYLGAEPIWMADGTNTMQRAIWNDHYDGWTRGNIKLPHFAIVSQSDPLFISYFPDEEKGMLGKRVKIAPGKYLKKYFSHLYSDRTIEAYANQHKEKYASVKILWAHTPEEISKVYTMPNTGFTSCMQKPNSYFDSTVKRNPTFVYGAGDLSLAYVVQDGYLTTRALVWKDKNKVGRVYGDPFILRAGLAKEGIETKSNNGSYDTFEGARLIKEFHDWDNKKMAVAPYIDGSYRFLKEEGDYFIISDEGRFHAEWTDGMARPRPFCELRQSFVSETVMVNVRNEDGTYRLAEWSRETGPDQMVMVQNSSSYADNNSRYYEANNPTLVMVLNRYSEPRYYSKRYYELYPQYFWTSDISGTLHNTDFQDRYNVEGKNMTENERRANAFVSEFDGNYYLNANKVKVEGAGYWHIDQARKHAHQMVEGDDTLFAIKKGFVFMGGKVIKKPKTSSKYEHLINMNGAVKLSQMPTFTYIRADDGGRSQYVVENNNWYLYETNDNVWRTNAPRDMFEPSELVG